MRNKLVVICCFFILCCNRKAETIQHTKQSKDTSHKQGEKPAKMFKMLNPLESGINFVNYLTETEQMNGFYYEYYYNGSGLALADVNNDGLTDILFLSTLRSNALFLNKGGLKFENITKASGLDQSTGFRTGITTVDINQDGLMDFYISKSGRYVEDDKRRNELWVNQGVGPEGIPTFKELAANYDLDIAMCSTQSAFFDYDLDGDLDMFLINHYPVPLNYSEADGFLNKKDELTGDRLYENRNGVFLDVTTKSGLTNLYRMSYGLGLSVGDVNNDKYPDVYVSNDYEGKDFLYINNGDGTFKDMANEVLPHTSFYSMGTDIADFNNDGWLDIISVDMVAEDNYSIKASMSGMNPAKFTDVVDNGLGYQYMYNALQMNNGVLKDNGPLFSDIAQLSGVSSTDWSWAPLFFDIDNDGYKDLFVSNGIKRDFRNTDYTIKRLTAKKLEDETDEAYISRMLNLMPLGRKENYFFKNNGDLTFDKKNGEWVMDIPSCSNGAAYGDLDNDGDLDLIVNNSDDVSLIYQNLAVDSGSGNFLKIDFEGSEKNRNGIGAKIKIEYDGQQQVMDHYVTRGFQSSVDHGLHFGLGNVQIVDKLSVLWPNGFMQELENVDVNQNLLLKQVDAQTPYPYNAGISNPLFQEKSNRDFKLEEPHTENSFDDYERESLLPHKMSQFGPALCVGDVDKDGLDDLFLGGSKGKASRLLRQTKEGFFVILETDDFVSDSVHEDVAATFFDVDGDGDLDLYVVSGGNEETEGSPYYLDRLYENFNGKFVRRQGALPKVFSSGSCVKPYDYDKDGDLDLFVGGRQFPGRYPTPVSSYLLRNDSSSGDIKFTDVSKEKIPDLSDLGMVTDAVWVDLQNDGNHDLVVVGEWMEVQIFRNIKGVFHHLSKVPGLENQVGWWNSIEVGDFDSDGDYDLVIGNLGLNYKYKASQEKPFKVYGNDFDENGSFDIVLGYHQGKNMYPLRGRQCSSEQMPFIKKKFPTYDQFARASLVDVYEQDKLDHSISYSATNFATMYYENKGEAGFKGVPLPLQSQITSVNDIMVQDFDKDGALDILLTGNLYGSEIETPRNDAGIGAYLKGDGTGKFEYVPAQESGLGVLGETRFVRSFKSINDSEYLIFARNNMPPAIVGKQ